MFFFLNREITFSQGGSFLGISKCFVSGRVPTNGAQAHLLIGAGKTDGAMDAANLLCLGIWGFGGEKWGALQVVCIELLYLNKND